MTDNGKQYAGWIRQKKSTSYLKINITDYGNYNKRPNAYKYYLELISDHQISERLSNWRNPNYDSVVQIGDEKTPMIQMSAINS